MSKRVLLLVSLAVVVVLSTAGTWWVTRDRPAANPQAAARTSFPDLTPAAGAPTLPSLSTLHPAAGKVVEAEGPFDDRFRFHKLSFDGTTVSGRAEITSDVSEVLEFEALAGFYDSQGRLLGTARHVHHLDESAHGHAHDEGSPDQTQNFSIAVPENIKDKAVAAAVGVPVLVNE